MSSHDPPAGKVLSFRRQHGKHSKQFRPYIRASPPARFRLLWLLVSSVAWMSLFGKVASQPHGDRQEGSTPFPAVLVSDIPQTWTTPSLLIIDTRSPPVAPPLMPPLQDGHSTRTTSAPPSKRSIEVDPGVSNAFEIPKPFDSALSNNFTNNCAGFFKRMLTSDTVNTCHPFSLMLQTSSGLFDASKSFVQITRTLEATCAANSTQCVDGTNSLARELITDGACLVDYNNNNPQVVQAYNGLLAYSPLYQASCLRDDDSNFCYADAVTNTTSAGADAYPYYLPLGVNMPGGARPTCNSCLQDAMAIFSTFAGNSTQPVSQTYAGAASQISIACGQTFINVTAVPVKGAAHTTTTTFTPTITLFIIFFIYLFQ